MKKRWIWMMSVGMLAMLSLQGTVVSAQEEVIAVEEASAEVQAFVMNYDNFQEIILAEDENCTFKITDVQMDEDGNYTWAVELENKTETEMMFSIDRAAINGYMCDPYWAYSVPAGSTEDTTVDWWYSELEKNGITHMENVEFRLRVSDYDDWDAEEYINSNCQITCDCGEVSAQEETSVEGEVLVDTENLLFVVKEMSGDLDSEYEWKVYLENRTEYPMSVYLDNVCVNGYACDPYWGAEINPGTKMNATMEWYGEQLDRFPGETMDQVEGTVRAYHQDDWTMDDLVNEPFQIYPNGEEAVQEQERIPVEGEKVLMDDEHVTMIVEDFETDEYDRFVINLYLENKTDSMIMFSMDNVTVNGTECDPYWGDQIPAGMKSLSKIYWYEDQFTEGGIETPKNIEGNLSIYDYDNWEPYFEGSVTLMGEGDAVVTGQTEEETEGGETETELPAEPSPYEEEEFKAAAAEELSLVMEDSANLENASDFVYALVCCLAGQDDLLTDEETYAPVLEYLMAENSDLSAAARNYMEDLGFARRDCVEFKAKIAKAEKAE